MTKIKRVDADGLRDATDVRGMNSEFPLSSDVVSLTDGNVASDEDAGGGGGDHVEFQEALCSMSTLPKQCGLTRRSFESHMLPALITTDLWYPLLSPEHLSLILMATWQCSLPTTRSDLILSLLARVRSDNLCRLRVRWVPLSECHSSRDLLKKVFREILPQHLIRNLYPVMDLLPVMAVEFELTTRKFACSRPFLRRLAIPVGHYFRLRPHTHRALLGVDQVNGKQGKNGANTNRMRTHFQLGHTCVV